MQLSLLKDNAEHKFRDLYYYLYSNSSASRSERILSDLSKLMLVALGKERGHLKSELALFMNGNGSANKILLPSLSKLYPNIVHADDKFSLDDRALQHSLDILSEINLTGDLSHSFGDAFQALMGPRLRGDKGQFFTPRSVVKSVVEILSPKAGSSVIDPACGTGGFLSAVLDHWRDKDLRGTVIGIDKDADLSLLATALSVAHDPSGQHVSIFNLNSLLLDQLERNGIQLKSFDYVVTNPPFGAKIGIADRATLQRFALGHVWERDGDKWSCTSAVRASQDPQILFLELCVRLLKDQGTLAIVLPEGVFGNSSSGYVWDFLRDNGEIDALIDCPRTTFQPGTDTKTNILFYRKTAKPKNRSGVWISVAYSCGHDRRGRSAKSDGTLVSDDFDSIAKDWHKAPQRRRIWNKVDRLQPYYLVPRYYDGRLSDDVRADAARLRTGTVALGELIDAGLISIRKGHEVGSDAYGTGDVPFVRTSDIHNFEISYDPTNCVSEEIFEQYRSQQNLKSGDILMVVDGRYKIGRCAVLHDWNTRCVVQSHLRIIACSDREKVDPLALLYSLSLPSVQREIRRLVFIQSTLGSLGQRIREIRLPDPTKSVEWGDVIEGFRRSVTERARLSAYLQKFEAEVEL